MMASQELGEEFFMVIAWTVHMPKENSTRLCSHPSMPRDRQRETDSKCQISTTKIRENITGFHHACLPYIQKEKISLQS